MKFYTLEDVKKIEKLLNCIINNKSINTEYLILFFKLLENGYITNGGEWYPVPTNKKLLIKDIETMIKYLYIGIDKKETEIYDY